jgi:hypothetical protein
MSSEQSEHTRQRDGEHRVIEVEYHPPRVDVHIDTGSLGRLPGQVIKTAIGLPLLLVQGAGMALQAANKAGNEAMGQLGSMAESMPRPGQRGEKTSERQAQRVQMLVIDNYDSLSGEEVIQRLEGLSGDDLRTLKAYETQHQGRQRVIAAIDGRISQQA